jgi:type I restriction enzyme R subunit
MLDFSENTLVEQPAIALFKTLGWSAKNCFNEKFGRHSTLGRATQTEVVLVPQLRQALATLNPTLPIKAIQQAIGELTRDRSAQSLVQANRDIYQLLKNGVRVSIITDSGEEIDEIVQVIDWREPHNNTFFLASQFWVLGNLERRRADLVGFVNGLPLVFIELKASHRRIEYAYRHNLRDYKQTIPQLFWYNAFIILSNGGESRIGSLTAEWEHFFDWKKINSQGDAGIVSLETIIRGTCEPRRLLDLVESFILFEESTKGLRKLVARNHQYLGVNDAIQAVRHTRDNQGRLGVFWHTQGSGKSYSMVFFTQKILRTEPGNWTFVMITDRRDLDKQLYETFKRVGAISERHVQARSEKHLEQLLREDHRYVFTLIQKFQTPRAGEPSVSRRSDIIVIADEAHRSQYDTYALNMRSALRNAAFIAFTGTPLIAASGAEKTRDVFGNYVSVYNFKQSIDDGATVPLYYENRIPELQLTNEELNEEMEQLLDAAAVNDQQEALLERQFVRQYTLITRDARLERIAKDIVEHFMGLGEQGKAMVVSIDQPTTVRMYDKVRRYWQQQLAELRTRMLHEDSDNTTELAERIDFMEQTDMAVVISYSSTDADKFKQKGLDVTPHHRRMNTDDLETKFKDPDNPLRIVFVCAMWMTGFDVPSCSVLYLDKPMGNHTLMQTIARPNRVFPGKTHGLIVDYIGVLREMQKALAIYATTPDTHDDETKLPIQSKAELITALQQAIHEARAFCRERGVDVDTMLQSRAFERLRLLDDAAHFLVDAKTDAMLDESVEHLLVNDTLKQRALALFGAVARRYRAILPDTQANTFNAGQTLFAVLAEKIRALTPILEIDDIAPSIEILLDSSIVPSTYAIREASGLYRTDLSQFDFDALKRHFTTGRKRIEAEKLRGTVNVKLQRLIRLNRTRRNYQEVFQHMIDEYNEGRTNVDIFFAELIKFAQSLNAEERRGIALQLTEEELAIFDLLTKPFVILSPAEEEQVRQIAKELLINLHKKLVLDWRKKQQTTARVRRVIDDVLKHLPPAYTSEHRRRRQEMIYQHVYDSYYGSDHSIYSQMP